MSERLAEPPIYAFEAIHPTLDLVPLAARRALDRAGAHLSLAGWRSLPLEARALVARAGAAEVVDLDVVSAAVSRATPPPARMDPAADPDPTSPPGGLVAALGEARPLDDAAWRALAPLDRFALIHVQRRAAERGDPARLAQAYDAIMPARAAGPALSSHLDERGEVHMVDVAGKEPTRRRAVASGVVRMERATAERLARHDAPKGEVFAAARIAGIMAAKRTPDLVPLCHAVALARVELDLSVDVAAGRVDVVATAEALDRTGVEMEALVAVSVACLTIYDMLKSIDRAMVIAEVKLLEKEGGRSGHFVRAEGRP
jgi:cyclic pyranopterin phosphate synthase